MKCSDSPRFLALLSGCWLLVFVFGAKADDSNNVPRYDVEGYVVKDTIPGSATNAAPLLSAYTGTNVSAEEIARAAAALQAEYARRGYPAVGVAVGPQEITNGIVTMHVFESAVPQIRISGKRYEISSNAAVEISNLLPPPVTNTVAVAKETEPVKPPKPLTPEEEALHAKMAELDLAQRRAMLPPQPPLTTQLVLAPVHPAPTNDVEKVLRRKMAELNGEARRAEMLPPDTNSVAQATNAGPVFEVKGYEVTGNTLLPTNTVQLVMQPYIGTNVTFDAVRKALTDLQTVYSEHGFATVSVTLPQQTNTDKIVKVRVFEGRLEEIRVVNNRYFSSNNVMRALPSLHANMILNAPVFQDELDLANANQDRQIYPAIEPGFVEGTSLLKLDVHDRFPLHAKTELNNENSPGTPELRVNSSVEYKNLWQMEHSLGLQYSFSPEKYKAGDQWNLYDKPLVANYSGFYRLPLGNPEAVANTINASTRFGYDEATRKFNLPPPSGQAELNIYASRSTIDTGVVKFPPSVIFDVPGVREVTRQDVHQDLTVNNAIGAQLTVPVAQDTDTGVHSTWSAGLTYKTYALTSTATNQFTFSEFTVDANGLPLPPTISTVSSPVPTAKRDLDYLPLTLRYDLTKQDSLGVTALGFGLTVNTWYSGSKTNLHNVTGSSESTGHWVTFNPTLTRDFNLPKHWTLSLHTEGQWASEPLVSTEQFGSGGVNSVRGYYEGEVFGDEGWRVDADIKTPPVVAGIVYGKEALTLRGAVFTDYSQVYLIDPQGRDGTIPLWSAGIGFVVSVGTHWESRLLFAVPFDSTTTTEALRPRFNFSLTAQF